MILKAHSDTSYLSSRDSRSISEGNFILGRKPQDKHPIHLNGEIFTLCHILKFVVSSEVEAEIWAIFLNSKEDKIMRLTLQ